MSRTEEALRAELAAAQRRVAELTEELEATNQGIIALHTELDAAREAEARAHADREVLAERDRIARDLQDQVIHHVFEVGLELQSILGMLGTHPTARRVYAVITELDDTVRGIRTAIFGLHGQPQRATSLRIMFTDLVGEHESRLGFTPIIDFRGPIDAAVPDHVATDLLAATRDTLAAITHVGAAGAEIALHATTDELVLRVIHDGRVATITSALRERARTHGGTADIAGGDIEWRVPLPRRASPE